MRVRTVPVVAAVGLVASSLLGATAQAAPPPPPPHWERVSTYTTGLADVAEELTSGEVAALDGDRLFVTNASDVSIDIVDVSDLTTPTLIERIDLSAYGDTVTSVDAKQGVVAVAVEEGANPGKLVFLNRAGDILGDVTVGAGPDMVTFAPVGLRVLVANEGEPTGYGAADDVDPKGSITVVDLLPFFGPIVRTIDFTAFDPGQSRAGELPAGVRVFGSPLPSLDLEPEYIATDELGLKAYVSLQENNAIAVLDLLRLRVERIDGLGYKDHSKPGNGMDTSDQDGGINITARPNILGMYQPDAVATFRVNGKLYVLSANEGDAREYDGLVEEARLRAQTTDASFGPARANNVSGRLNVTTRPPASAFPQSTVYAFGARSFSLWDARTGALVHDSGDLLERFTATALPDNFNSNNSENTFDDRSDNKGPEPEAVAVGTVSGRTYGFVGLERIGGVVVVDLSNPRNPQIVQYLQNRSFATDEVGQDSGPEVIQFVDAGKSPSRQPLLVVSNEITGTVSIYTLA
jgi:hypothetical protein